MSAMSAMSAIGFNASVYVSEQLNRQLVNMAQDLAYRCVDACAERYGFDAEEAHRFLGLAMVKVERKAPIKEKSTKAAKVSVPKAAFPLPYNGELNDAYCYALRQNNGLYTQCTGVRKGENQFCKSCASAMQKTGAEVPEYGTIQQRKAVGIFEYVDPKGRKPIAYTKIMKKHNLTEDKVLEEAGKFGIIINKNHFVAPTEETKRGRPKAVKEPKVKGTKGRPKKEKKVLMIEGENAGDDLFTDLVSAMNEADDEDIVIAPKKKAGKSDAEKEAEKEAKRLAAEKAKAEKEAKLAAEKAEKEAKKEAERLAREEKKKAEEEAKRLKEEQRLKEKAEKEAKLAAEKAAKESAKAKKSSKKPAEPEPEVEEEPDVVKKIEFDGKKYLKSKKTGIIYDYKEYVNNGEQVIVGKWNEKTNKIDFTSDEEEEEEYDM